MLRGLLDQPWGRRLPWPRWLNRGHSELGQAKADQSRSSMMPSWLRSRCPNSIANQRFEWKGVGVTTENRDVQEVVCGAALGADKIHYLMILHHQRRTV